VVTTVYESLRMRLLAGRQLLRAAAAAALRFRDSHAFARARSNRIGLTLEQEPVQKYLT
jgi:hypothetical protein